MFKTMLDTQMIFYLMGVIGGIGILSKLVSEGTLDVYKRQGQDQGVEWLSTGKLYRKTRVCVYYRNGNSLP